MLLANDFLVPAAQHKKLFNKCDFFFPKKGYSVRTQRKKKSVKI